MTNCENLVTLPSSICNIRSLERLVLQNCSKLQELPKNPMTLQCSDMIGLCSLMDLNLSGCNLMGGAIPSDLWCLSSLRRLNLSGSNIRCIPSGISQLRILQLNHCKMLESITELPSSLRVLDAHDCTRLDTLSSLSSLLQCSLFSCFKSAIQELEHGIESSKSIGINIVIPGSRGIPEWISNQELGSEVTVELPMNWCEDNDFLGFALCSLYVPLDDAFEDGGLECRLIAFHGDQFRRVDDIWFKSSCKYYENGGVSYLHKCCDNGDVSDCVLWVTYYPQIAIKKKHRSNQWRHFKALFNGLYNCGSKAFKVKKCGVHLIYAQDFQPNHYSSQLLRETANCNVKRSRDDTESDPAEGPSHKRLRDLEP